MCLSELAERVAPPSLITQNCDDLVGREKLSISRFVGWLKCGCIFHFRRRRCGSRLGRSSRRGTGSWWGSQRGKVTGGGVIGRSTIIKSWIPQHSSARIIDRTYYTDGAIRFQAESNRSVTRPGIGTPFTHPGVAYMASIRHISTSPLLSLGWRT